MNNHPTLYYIDRDYLKHMHRVDYRVSVKFNNRPFVGIVTTIGSQQYVIPLTSQTTDERKKEGKKKRSANITTFVTESSGIEIANILYNNMIPVYDDVITPVAIDATIDTYESNEVRFIRKNWEMIQEKALKVYTARYNPESHNYDFFAKTCCEFKKLEIECANYQKNVSVSFDSCCP